MVKTVSGIAALIEEGNATVCTASEVKKRIREGDIPTLDEVDVVTCGTCGIMSGTYAVLSVPVTKPGIFRKADTITLNGVPAFPGPCPNEGLGLVDCIVYGTAHAGPRYGGGHLFRDIAEGKEISIEVVSERASFEKTLVGDEIPFARLLTSRSAFKNYSAIVNQQDQDISTIFSVLPLKGNGKEATVSGCGEINPLANDPTMRFIRAGTPILLNGANGLVLGTGTRSSRERPNIALSADFSGMNPEYMGGFVTSAGPECLTSVGSAIPVLDETALSHLFILDKEITMPIMNILDRSQVDVSEYGRVWQGTGYEVTEDPDLCIRCDTCLAEQYCPTGAIVSAHAIDNSRCLSCGTCTRVCPGGVYSMKMGSILCQGRETDIVLRQSDRRRGERLSEDLKNRILDGTFQI